ncbi:hypothetical protein BDN71DRAFT_1442254 [Pleurotus eryngii]|uniref:Uncharacterized protein n=1 Tax=Pleurotus eryngii TaxID=5323 RepID=A0A9P6A4Q5_PLEER|nr:hypothetical protein BDN71DRAFT_1442254 [Pleurotus eryngii]
MFSKTIIAAVLLVVASTTLADPVPPRGSCLEPCFPADHVCGTGQILVPPADGGDCFSCCAGTPPTPRPTNPLVVCSLVCFPPDHVCPPGQRLLGAGDCFNCCTGGPQV